MGRSRAGAEALFGMGWKSGTALAGVEIPQLYRHGVMVARLALNQEDEDQNLVSVPESVKLRMECS